MAYRDIFAPVFGDDSDVALISALDAIPLFAGAHVATTLISPFPDPILVGDIMGGGASLSTVIDRAQVEAQATQERLLRLLRTTNLAFEQRVIQGQVLTACNRATMQARHADLTVMARPSPHVSDFRHEVLEAILMASGRPLMLLPPIWSQELNPRRIFIAWNASREAARAVADAAPFLAAASAVIVGTIDARPGSRDHGEAPAADVATHLARHGLPVEVKNLDSLWRNRSDAIVSAAEDALADLIVLGGYGHSRVREALFGGVTRTLIDTSPLPLLMSH